MAQNSPEHLLASLGHISSLISSSPSVPLPDIGARCKKYPLLSKLRNVLGKPTMTSFTEGGADSAVAISFDIYEQSEIDHSLVSDCPFGLASALVYLSVAQESAWKHRLLHRASHLIFSTPGAKEALDGWPVTPALIETLYRNTEAATKGTVSVIGEVAGNSTLSVRPRSILFYNFFLPSLCECTSQSFCQPFWAGHAGFDVFIANRDSAKSVFRFVSSRGCFVAQGWGLADTFISDSIDIVVTLEVNGFMHPEMRAIKRRMTVLYPAFALSSEQSLNFHDFGVTVFADDSVIPVPNPSTLNFLSAFYATGMKKRQLIYPAEIIPGKGQVELLNALLSEEDNLLEILNLRLVFVGQCEADVGYCHAFDLLVKRSNTEWKEEVSVRDMAEFICSSKGLVFFPTKPDINPQVIYQGLWCDVPFLVNRYARLSNEVVKSGRISDDPIDGLTLFSGDTNRSKWKRGDIRTFAENRIQQDLEYSKQFKHILDQWTAIVTQI